MAVPSTAQTNTTGNMPQYASLYVGDLDTSVTEATLYEVFNAVGPVASIRVCRDSVSRRSLGYAYVNFHSVQDAERALNSLNYTPIKGRACRIMWSQKDPALRRSGQGNVFVRNLDRSIDNKALYDTFSLFGNILSCKVATDPDGKSRGFGFVHFEAEESAKAAIDKLNGMQLGDKIVFVGGFLKQSDREDSAPKIFTNVYIKQLPLSCDEDRIRELFGKYGPVTSTYITTDAKGRRFAFVNFENFDDAAKSVDEMHAVDIRTDEEKVAYEADKEARKKKAAEEGVEFFDEDENVPEGEVPSYQLYVARAQSKAERLHNLKSRYAAKTSDGKPGAGIAPPGCNLYVKNLGEDVDDKQLKDLFDQFGTITSAKVMVDPNTGVSRGFGFVCYTTPEEATKAVTEMHLKLVYGKPLYVGLHEKKEERVERLQQQYRAAQPGMPGSQFGVPRGFGGPQGMGFPGQSQMMFNGARPGMPGGPGFPGQGFGSMGMGPRPGMPGMMGAGYPSAGPRPGMSYGGPQMAPQMRGPMSNPMFGGKGKGPMNMPVGSMPMRAPMMGQPPIARPGMPIAGAGPRPSAGYDAGAPLTAAALAAAPPGVQKQMLGEKLFPLVARMQPDLAGKITGMMLEMDNSELLILLESEGQLRQKVDEALRVLEAR